MSRIFFFSSDQKSQIHTPVLHYHFCFIYFGKCISCRERGDKQKFIHNKRIEIKGILTKRYLNFTSYNNNRQ